MRRLCFAVLLSALLSSLPAGAQTCSETDTPEECFQRFDPAADTKTSVANAVATTNTGSPNLSTINSTALRDFLSVFTAVVQTGTVTEQNGAITVDYNLPLDLMHDDDVIKLQATFATPELDAQLKTALGTNTDAITTLTDELDETDDMTFSATFSPSTPRFGRSMANHNQFIESIIQAVKTESGASPAVLAARLGMSLAGTSLQQNTPFTTIADPTTRTQAIAGVEAAARSFFSFDEKFQDVIAQIANLLNNQEQVYASAIYNDLDELAGPDSWSLKLTYEMGGKNITKFLSNNADCADQRSVACLNSLRTYASDPTDRSWRIAASVDIAQTDAYAIDLPQFEITGVSAPASESTIIAVTAGRRLDPPTSTRERRIDFTGSYENVSDDPNLDDRLVASVTYTQEITNTFTLPITLTYANKEKYLGDVDDKLGVHFGISYKLPKLMQ